MKSSLRDAKQTIYAAEVKYIDYTCDQIPADNLLYPIIHKRKSFEHEKEVRLIWPRWAEHFFHDVDKLQPGYRVPVSVNELLLEVFVSPTSKPWLRDLVESVTRQYGVNCPVKKSDLFADPVL